MQRKKLLNILIEYCNEKGSKTFSLKQLNTHYQNYSILGIGGNTPQATIRRLLQELQRDKMLSFLDTRGFYTLGGENLDFLLEEEKLDLSNIDLSKETNKEKIEYTRETYYRDSRLVKLAIETFGLMCLYPQCKNTFLKEDKKPYIEVHHIVPLYKEGIDKLENLSVVCAHHHKMAHFSDMATKIRIEKVLYNETRVRL